MRVIHLAAGLACVAAAVAGCSKADSSAAKPDSTAVLDTARVRDSIQAAFSRTNDSLAAAAAAAASAKSGNSTTGTTGETRKSGHPATSMPKKSPGGRIIGRDSMTMPVGTMDSMGKVTRIKRETR